MAWLENVFPVLFILIFIYGLAKQLKQSVLLQKTVSPSSSFNKRLLIGNHLFSFAFAGFVIVLVLNALVYTEVLPQTQSAGNTVSLAGFLFVLLMFVFKFAVIPKNPQASVQTILKKN